MTRRYEAQRGLIADRLHEPTSTSACGAIIGTLRQSRQTWARITEDERERVDMVIGRDASVDYAFDRRRMVIMCKNRQERHETVDINVASASTARRTRLGRRQPRASAAHMLGGEVWSDFTL